MIAVELARANETLSTLNSSKNAQLERTDEGIDIATLLQDDLTTRLTQPISASVDFFAILN